MYIIIVFSQCWSFQERSQPDRWWNSRHVDWSAVGRATHVINHWHLAPFLPGQASGYPGKYVWQWLKQSAWDQEVIGPNLSLGTNSSPPPYLLPIPTTTSSVSGLLIECLLVSGEMKNWGSLINQYRGISPWYMKAEGKETLSLIHQQPLWKW